MTDNTQPEALMQLADVYAEASFDQGLHKRTLDDAPESARSVLEAAVRRQHARIADLEAQLAAIGAGGVTGPLIGQPQAMPDLSQLTERGAKAWAGVDAQGLREGFTAADMATAAAQGFRDGAASTAPPAAQAEGWRLVPVEPTIDQEWAGKQAALQGSMAEACKIYKAMLAAAPAPPTSAEGVEHADQG